MYYKKCPICGSNNDPGEICDCIKVNNRKLTNTLNYKSETMKNNNLSVSKKKSQYQQY